MSRRDRPTAAERYATATRRERSLRRGGCWLLIVLLAAVATAGGGVDAAVIQPTRFVTANGIIVLVLEQHALPIVQLQALVKVGSAQDPPAKAGLANLVAMMLDEGTTTRSANGIADAIDFVGGSLNTDVSRDFTAVSSKVLKKDIDLAFQLLADILLHPTFPEDELARVRSQVIGEIQSEQEDPETVALKAFHTLVFKGHPYRWPVQGTLETVPGLSRQDLRAFYATEYQPNQTIVAVVGDVTVSEVRARVEQYFRDWKRREPPSRGYPQPESVTKPTVHLIDRELTQSTIILGHVGISRNDPDYYPVTVMNYILGAGGFSSRLMDTIRDRQGLVYGVASAFDANLMRGPFFVSLQTRNEATNQAIQAVLKEIERIRSDGVSDQELAEAKAYLSGSFPLRLDTVSEVARILSFVEFYGLGLEYFTEYPKWIERVTSQEVLLAARNHLHPERYVMVVVGDLSKAKVAVEAASHGGGRHE